MQFLFLSQDLQGLIHYFGKLMPVLPVTLIALCRAVSLKDDE